MPASTPSAGATFSFSASSALIGGDANRRADARRRRAAARQRADAVERVADLRRDLRRLEPERLGGDRPRRACACRCRGPASRARMMTLPSDAISQCACAGPRPPPPHVPTATPMPVLIGPGRLVAGRMPLVPAEFRGALAQVRAPHRIRRFGRQVLDPELDRIHLHLVRQLVHHDLGDERALRMARRAHRPLLAGVDEDVLVRRGADSRSDRCTAAGSPRPRRRRPCPTTRRRTR